MKRSPLPPRRKPLRRVSKRRRLEAKLRRAVLREVARRDDVACWAQRVYAHECEGPLDGHELTPRSARPGGHLDAGNVRLICRAAHDWIHSHPLEATAIGLLRHSWDEQPEWT